MFLLVFPFERGVIVMAEAAALDPLLRGKALIILWLLGAAELPATLLPILLAMALFGLREPPLMFIGGGTNTVLTWTGRETDAAAAALTPPLGRKTVFCLNCC